MTVAFVLLINALPVYSQQPTKVQESVDVTLIEIPVTVADRGGNSLRGLTRDNFEIFDEGKKRSIAYFEQIDLRAIADTPEAETVHPVAVRKFMLVFDLSSTKPQNLQRARDAAKQFVRTQVEKRDLVAVTTFAVENGFQLLANFSRDRELAAKAIDDVGHPRFFGRLDPLALADERPAGAERPAAENARGSNVHDLPVMNDLGESGQSGEITKLLEEYDRRAQQSQAEHLSARLRSQLKNFGGLASALDAVPGKKQVILLSEGFRPDLLHGRESGASADEMEAVITGEIWKVNTEARYGHAASVVDLFEMASLFRRSDVVLHAVDIAGLRSNNDARQGRSSKTTESSEGLFLIANPTGGQVFKNENELSSNFRRMLAQQEVIYVLGFQLAHSERRGIFRNLEVKLRNVPRGSRASHRPGYYDRPEDRSPLATKLATSSIFTADLERRDVEFRMTAVAFPSRTRPTTSVFIEIPPSAFPAKGDGDSVSTEILVYAFTADGQVADFLHEKTSFDFSKVAGALGRDGFTYHGVLALDPGDYVLKTLVRMSETERTGFRKFPIHVPSFNTPTLLSPLILQPVGDRIVVNSMARAPEAAYPLDISGMTFVPELGKHLQNGERYRLAILAHDVPDSALELDVRLRDAEGNELNADWLAITRTPRDAYGVAKLLVDFTPRFLAPGEYRLEVALREAVDGVRLHATAGFSIE